MHYQQQYNLGMAENRADSEVAETAAQSFEELQADKQQLTQDQSGKRRQLLILESQRRDGVNFAVKGGSAKLHMKRPPSCICLFRKTYFTLKCRPLHGF